MLMCGLIAWEKKGSIDTLVSLGLSFESIPNMVDNKRNVTTILESLTIIIYWGKVYLPHLSQLNYIHTISHD